MPALSHRKSPRPTSAPPGTEERIAELAHRAARGISLYVDGDCDSMEALAPGQVKPVFDRSMRWRRGAQGQTGVERDSRRRHIRARCYWAGKKHPIGFFASKREAIQAAERFWRETLGLFWQHRRRAYQWMHPLPQLIEAELPPEEVKAPRRRKHACLFCSLGECGPLVRARPRILVMRAAARVA